MKQFNPNKKYMTFHPNDIEAIEESILEGYSFNQEQRNFIHFLDSGVIEAGPGSGKTTTLGAKIALLIERFQQINSNRGMCIITHTNAAVKEIENLIRKAGISSIQHPHFIGTIDSFFINFILRPWYKKLGIPLTIHNSNSEFRWKDFFVRCHSREFNYNLSPSVLKSVLKRINALEYEFDGYSVKIYKNDSWSNSWSKLSNYKNRFKCTIKEYYRSGNINLAEAQSLTASLIKNKEYDFNLLSKRFPYFFIDEYQDQMHDSFLTLLSDLKNNGVNIQVIGDANQHIYFGQPYYKVNSLPFNYYNFNITNRFSDEIAKPLNMIFDGKIQPADFTKSEKPILYTYDKPENISQFINFFPEKNSSVLVSNHKHAKDLNSITQEIKRNELSTIQSVTGKLTGILSERLGVSQSKCRQLLRQNYEKIYIELNKFILKSIYKKNDEDDQIEFLKNINEILSGEKVSKIRRDNLIFKKFLGSLDKLLIDYKQESKTIPIHTIHSVKGLTFNSICVYLPEGSDIENAFLNTYDPLKEHLNIYKRIVYVAMSRPKKQLVVALSKNTYDSLEEAVIDKIKQDFCIR